jgi:hypothetical protein
VTTWKQLMRIALVMVTLFWIRTSWCASSTGLSLERKPERLVALTNSAIVCNAVFTNGTSNVIRGFCYTEQLPTALRVTDLGVSMNGVPITNYLFVSCQSDDVYSNCTPRGWLLEAPPLLGGGIPAPAGSVIEIKYSVSASAPGTFDLREYSWFGYDQSGTNSLFGYSDSSAAQTLTFVASARPAVLAVFGDNGSVTIRVSESFGASYVLERSADLVNWVPVATNVAPSDWAEPNAAIRNASFYRALWVP